MSLAVWKHSAFKFAYGVNRWERDSYGSMGFQFSSHLNLKNNGLTKSNSYFQTGEVLKGKYLSEQVIGRIDDVWVNPQVDSRSGWGLYPQHKICACENDPEDVDKTRFLPA